MKEMWLIFAILSAVFAAATSILAKIGIEGVDSNLATAIRTMVVLLMAWGMVFLTNAQGGISAIRTIVVLLMAWGMVFLTHSQGGVGSITPKSWLFLILSGFATGASLLCSFYALKIGEVNKVVPIDKCSLVLTILFAASS